MDFMSFGFTMAFCALFSKTFRVHLKTLRTVTNKIMIKRIDNISNNINE